MSPKIGLALVIAALAVASTGLALSRDSSPAPTTPYAVSFEDGATPRAEGTKEAPSDASSGILVLVGFLGLIAGNLFRWSGDTSCKSNRSVFS